VPTRFLQKFWVYIKIVFYLKGNWEAAEITQCKSLCYSFRGLKFHFQYPHLVAHNHLLFFPCSNFILTILLNLAISFNFIHQLINRIYFSIIYLFTLHSIHSRQFLPVPLLYRASPPSLHLWEGGQSLLGTNPPLALQVTLGLCTSTPTDVRQDNPVRGTVATSRQQSQSKFPFRLLGSPVKTKLHISYNVW